ncbi:MAG: DUF6538 domain-containing protein [Ruegeria sp.]
MRRGRIFYFRKRLPKKLSNQVPNQFLCLSLRTDLPLDAVKRAAALLTVLEQMEKTHVDALIKNSLNPETAKAVLTEMLRSALEGMLQEQNQDIALSAGEVDQRIEALQEENRRLRRAARNRQWTDVEPLLRAAGDRVALNVPTPISNDLGKRATTLQRRLNEVEIAAQEGDDVRYASSDLLAEHGLDDFDKFVQAPVLLSQARARTDENHSSKAMKKITASVYQLTEEFLGDIPVSSLTKERQKEFLGWASRLPRTHGKSHGRNRFESDGKNITKEFEISQADAADFQVMEEVRTIEGLSNPEKRALLAERLVPRVTLCTLKKYRDAMNRMFKSASELGPEIPKAISYKEMQRHIQSLAPEDELYVRVTKPKNRMPWTTERIARLLTSPIYSGAASEHRRWQRGKVIVRDADYWVPLIVLSIGSRIEEILLLKRSDVRYRDGTYVLAIASGPEATGKTEDSERLIPIPQILLDLGFVEWFQSLRDDHGPLLFPEAVRRSSTGDVTSAYGKHLRRIFGHLGIGDFDEDFYALRKTFSSMLKREMVVDGERQAIAGHKNGNVLNVFYTAHHVQDLKKAVDKADFKLIIGKKYRYGFPVILACNLAQSSTLEIEVTLDECSQAESVSVKDPQLEKPLFHMQGIGSLSDAALKKAATKLRDVTDLRPLKLPKYKLKRAAFEHLLALA